MASINKNILRLQGFNPEYMFVTRITRADVIVSQPVRLEYDLWLVVKSGFVRIASDIVTADIPVSSFSVLGCGRLLEVLDISGHVGTATIAQYRSYLSYFCVSMHAQKMEQCLSHSIWRLWMILRTGNDTGHMPSSSRASGL